MITQDLKTKLLVIAREKIAEVLDEVDMILSSALSQMQEATREETEQRGKNNCTCIECQTQREIKESQQPTRKGEK